MHTLGDYLRLQILADFGNKAISRYASFQNYENVKTFDIHRYFVSLRRWENTCTIPLPAYMYITVLWMVKLHPLPRLL